MGRPREPAMVSTLTWLWLPMAATITEPNRAPTPCMAASQPRPSRAHVQDVPGEHGQYAHEGEPEHSGAKAKHHEAEHQFALPYVANSLGYALPHG